jgi:glycosyltransferase involved in cell wall biosynthesis
MIQKPVVFYFLFADWDVDPRKHLLTEVIKAASSWSDGVLIQQPVCLIGHFFTKFRRKIIGLLTGRYRLRRTNEGILLFTPVILFNYSLWLRFKLISAIDIFLFKIQYERFVKKYFRQQKIILWLFYNRLYPILDSINFDLIAYDYQDNFDYLPDGSLSPMDAKYNEMLIRRSNFIICTARALYTRAKSFNENSFYIPNGNNFAVLSNTPEQKSKNELFKCNDDTKIIGYLGGIRKWLDFELVETILNEFQDCLFVSIGIVYRYAKSEFNRIRKYPNFYWINHMEPRKLPVYLRNFDVGIIPFKLNKFMEGVFPNKFFEYMAAGVPVVTTAIPELEKYSDYIGYARNNNEFIEYLSGYLHKHKKVNLELNRDLASSNSWAKRAEEINCIMEMTFNKYISTECKSTRNLLIG